MTDKEWIEKAIPFLESKLWAVSDCLAFVDDDGRKYCEFEELITQQFEEDHKTLTELLKHVGRL
jgi:hypothetical protein